jgi:hypothetical protein
LPPQPGPLRQLLGSRFEVQPPITDEQADAAYADLINTTMEQRGIENLSSEELDQLDKGGTMYVISYLFINILLLLIFILYKVGKRCQDNSK